MIDYDPFDERVRKDPLPFYQRLRDESPVHALPRYDAFALSRFHDIWECSSHPAFSAAFGTTPAQVLTKDQPVTPMLNVMDPPEHTRLRSIVRKAFLPRNVRALEPTARALFEQLLEEAREKGEACDIVQDLGARLSVQVACLAIGLPPEDGPRLVELVQRFFEHDPDTGGMKPEGMAALQELTAYAEQIARERRKQPSDGTEALNGLLQFETSEGRKLTDAEIGSHTTMLIIGGSETFPKTLANGVVRLAQHPDQRRRLADEPGGIPAAYDEILRYDMPTQFLCRTLTEDVELHGTPMRAGSGVMFLYASANRDPREFERPDEFDTTRKPTRFLSFGAGTHACLGTHVARMEGRITLETLLARFPEYEVDLESAERFDTEFVQGYSSLEVRLR